MQSVRQPARQTPNQGGSAGEIPVFTSSAEMLAHYRAVRMRLAKPTPPAVRLALPPPPPPPPETPPVVEEETTPPEPRITDTPSPHAESILTMKRITPLRGQDVIKAVCRVTGLSQEELCSQRRMRPLIRARFMVYMLCCKFTSGSLGMIGKWVGHRDHSTVLHGFHEGIRNIEELRDDLKRICDLLGRDVPDFSRHKRG